MLLDVALLAVALAGPAAPPAEQPQPERLDIRLENVRMQILPPEIAHVHIDPKGRVWYERTAPGGIVWSYGYDWPLDRVKACIAAEFNQPSPQITGARVELFEPNGRVWFQVEQHNTLLGYDGHTWIEHHMDDIMAPHYLAATQGRSIEGRPHRATKNGVWFMYAHGILRFDGKDWSFQQMLNHEGRYIMLEFLWDVSEDGDVAIAHEGGTGTLWVFRDGKWKADPNWIAPNQVATEKIQKLVLRNKNQIWYFTEDRRLVCKMLEPLTTLPDSAGKLIDQLKSDDFATRERAMRELAKLGPTYRIALEEQSKMADDLEQKSRLNQILKQWKNQEQTGPVTGSLAMDAVRYLARDDQGRMIVVAFHLGPRSEQGLAVIDSNNHAEVFYSDRLIPAIQTSEQSSFRMESGGDQAWVTMEGHAKLLDLKKKQFIDAVRFSGIGHVEGVSADGRVFITASQRSYQRGDPIVVYSPNGTENSPTLPATSTTISDPRMAVTPDGDIWAGGEDLQRFSGGKWATIKPPFGLYNLLPGQDGMVLALGDTDETLRIGTSNTALYRGEKDVAHGTLDSLIKQNQKAIAKGFAPHSLSPGLTEFQSASVVADPIGNVWMYYGYHLRVLSGDNWHEIQRAVLEGKEYNAIQRLLPLGDGSKVIVAATRFDQGTRPVLGEIRNGKPHFTELNAKISPMHPGLRDAQGNLWLGGADRSNATILIKTDGTMQTICETGHPLLLDASGNIWIGPNSEGGIGTTEFEVWKNGRKAQSLSIPGLTAERFLFSDRPGSVYVWTGLGLKHFVADGPEYVNFRLDRFYTVPALSGTTCNIKYSKQGYLVFVTAQNAPGQQAGGELMREFKLFTVPLPK